jgi:hypothetical protein
VPATLADRHRLAELTTFRNRVAAACYKVANDIGQETAQEPSDRADKRIQLLTDLFRGPDTVAGWFARAAAGWNPTSPVGDIGDTFADSAGGTDDLKQAAITDATIIAYVAGAWNVLAGVRPWERSA